jgi:hypothetical protein
MGMCIADDGKRLIDREKPEDSTVLGGLDDSQVVQTKSVNVLLLRMPGLLACM